jgi:putative oxidoreductase
MTRDASTGLLILRLVVAIVMFFHGTQKLFGWWGGA